MSSERSVAVVTGASQGIGQAYAQRLAEEGFDVAIADLSPAGETEQLVRDAGARAFSTRCDVTDEDEVGAFAEAVREEFGGCDVLVNNAGIYPFDTFDTTTFAQWRKVLSVSLDAPFLMAKAFVPMMREHQWGRVVNVSSSEIWLVNPHLHYITAKTGVIGFTRALATEVAADGITVNAIAPGITATPTTEREASGYLESLPAMQAIQRAGQPRDMAGILAFLISDDAAFFTAQVLIADGGWVRA